jgi:hypothetical protein
VARLFHVTSVDNRASITEHGLDWTWMNAARGIAGSRRPEQEGCFLADESTADFFVQLNGTGGPVDVWAVEDVDEVLLLTSPEGFEYLPERISANRLTLVRRDIGPPPPPCDTGE